MYSTVLALSLLFNCQEFKNWIVKNVDVSPVCKRLGEILLNRGKGDTIMKLLISINKALGDGKQHDSAEFLISLFNSEEETLKKLKRLDLVKILKELFSLQKSVQSVCQSCQTKKKSWKETNFLLQIG